ncbi:hypothetical protein DL96DRAFT_1623187 [Flagelloscypha sp. PMI_526]|nr:hypothetical protein DL96DRAFT_1623187 [Flagelloscypha sp. PMI_526]
MNFRSPLTQRRSSNQSSRRNQRFVDCLIFPIEIWLQIVRLIDDEKLWQLRSLCSTFRKAALDRKFQVLDLSFVSDSRLDAQWNSWKPRLDRLENWLNWIEQPYIFKRVVSITLVPHVEYALNRKDHGPPRPSLFCGILAGNNHPATTRPTYKKEFARVPQITERLERLLQKTLPLNQIISLTIISLSRSHFGDWNPTGKMPPHPVCRYATQLLHDLSPHLRHLHLDLNAGGPPAHHALGLEFDKSPLAFPLLETLQVDFQQPAVWYVRHLQHILGRSPCLHTVKIRYWLMFGATHMPLVPIPICLDGKSVTNVRTMDVSGGAWPPEVEIPFDLLPVLSQIEDLTLRRILDSAPIFMEHLNPAILRRLALYLPCRNALYASILNTFRGGDSVLTELVLHTSSVHLDIALQTLPVFPRLVYLALTGVSWDTHLLTRLPVSRPELKTLSLCAHDGILLHNSSRFMYQRVKFPHGLAARLTQDIERMDCDSWTDWGLEKVALLITPHMRLPHCIAATDKF